MGSCSKAEGMTSQNHWTVLLPKQNLVLSPWRSTEGLYEAGPQAWDRPRISVVKFTVVHPKMRTWPPDPSRLVLETCVQSILVKNQFKSLHSPYHLGSHWDSARNLVFHWPLG